jgi:hypothetical protein
LADLLKQANKPVVMPPREDFLESLAILIGPKFTEYVPICSDCPAFLSGAAGRNAGQNGQKAVEDPHGTARLGGAV